MRNSRIIFTLIKLWLSIFNSSSSIFYSGILKSLTVLAKYGLVNRKSVTDNYVIFYNLGPPKNWMGKFLRPCITSIASQLQSYAVIN